MNLLTYAIAGFCFFFAVFCHRNSVLFQKMCGRERVNKMQVTDDIFGSCEAKRSLCARNWTLWHLYLQYIYSFSRCFYPNWRTIEEIINIQSSCIAQEKRTPWFLTARSGMTQWPSSGRQWRLWTIHAVGLEFVPVMEPFTHLVRKFSLGTVSLLHSSGFCSVSL